MSELILASASPRRRVLLAMAGVHCEIRPADVDERAQRGETADAHVRRLARTKAETVAALARAEGDERPVLGADTVVELDGILLGKPRDRTAAEETLHALSGREHKVFSAVALVGRYGIREVSTMTRVRFRALTDQEIRAYVDSGEADDKAGAYAIQGHGAAFIERFEGSLTGVIGLPLPETLRLLEAD